MRTGLIFTLSILFFSLLANASELEKFTPEKFMAAQADGKRIALQYHADWCPTCKKQQATLSTLMKNPKYKEIVFMQANYDKETEFKEKHMVKGQSTFILFKGDMEVSRSQGETDKSSLMGQLDKLSMK